MSLLMSLASTGRIPCKYASLFWILQLDVSVVVSFVLTTPDVCNRMQEDGDNLAYDSESASVIRLSNGMVLYLREVNNYLALVCLLRTENFQKQGAYVPTNNSNKTKQ